MRRSLLGAAGGAAAFTVPEPTWANAQSILDDLETLYTLNAFTVTVSGVTKAQGFKPANGEYNNLYPRDHAYTLWHYPEKLTATQRRQFVTYMLERRTTGSESDPQGGTFPADLVVDHMGSDGTATWRNNGLAYPANRLIADGIHFVILALWTDWNETGDTTTFTASQSAIEDCLAAIPRAASGCVYSDPSDALTDYGFTDGVEKLGEVCYGTALLAWDYKMLNDMGGSYTTERAAAEAGLATLRKVSGWYADSDTGDLDDVWATALIVAEGLVSGSDRTASATKLRDAYLADEITQNGYVRHLPVGQYWPDSWSASDTYQDGGYWLTPLWDCYRAVALVDQTTAVAWVQEALDTIEGEITALGASQAPTEWRNGATLSIPKGYTCHAAIVKRFV